MAQPSGPPPLSATWLDVLPEEVCDRVAEHVTRSVVGKDAINLASLSAKQTRSAARSLSHPVFLNFDKEFRYQPFAKDADIHRWMQVFKEYPLNIRMTRPTPYGLQFLRQANIDEVSIRADNKELLKALFGLRPLRKLDLNISCQTDIDLAVCVLSSLTLDVLTVREEGRSFENLPRFVTASLRCIEACGPTTEFHWVDGNGIAEESRSYWRALRMLPDCTHIDLGALPSENVLAKLSKFQSVKVKWMHPSVAHRIGSAVVSYRNYFMFPSECRALDDSDVMLLTSCSRLQVLSLHVAASAQNAMVKLITGLPSLDTLILFWYNDQAGNTESVVEPTPGVMRSMLRSSSKLEFLDVGNAHVPLSEWEEILAHLGGHLKFLYVDVKLGRYELCKLASTLLSSISKSCRKIRQFTLYSKITRAQYPEKEDVDKVLHAARLVQMTKPMLNSGDLVKDVAKLLTNPRVDENDCSWITELLRRSTIHGNHMT